MSDEVKADWDLGGAVEDAQLLCVGLGGGPGRRVPRVESRHRVPVDSGRQVEREVGPGPRVARRLPEDGAEAEVDAIAPVGADTRAGEHGPDRRLEHESGRDVGVRTWPTRRVRTRCPRRSNSRPTAGRWCLRRCAPVRGNSRDSRRPRCWRAAHRVVRAKLEGAAQRERVDDGLVAERRAAHPPTKKRPRLPTVLNHEKNSRPEVSVSGSTACALTGVMTSGIWKKRRRSALRNSPRSGIVGPVWPSNFTPATRTVRPIDAGRSEIANPDVRVHVLGGVAHARFQPEGRRKPRVERPPA